MDWDKAFEELAKETARRNDKVNADPAYQAKRKAEAAKHEAGIGVYTADEIAAHEAEEAEDEE